MSDQGIDIHQKYFKLASVIDTFLQVDVSLSVAHFFQLYLTAAKWYLVQLKTVHAQDVKTILLDVSDVLTAQLPPDCVKVTKIGEPWGQYVRTIGVEDDLMLTDRTLGNPDFIYSGNPKDLPNGVNVENYGGYYFNNYGGNALFSIGGGLPTQGFYKIKKCDGRCQEILFNPGLCGTQIYVEYIGVGFNPCGATVLSTYDAEAVRKFLNHHFEKTRKDGGKSEAAIFRTGRELNHAEAIVKASRNDLDPVSICQCDRRSYRLTNKI